MKDVSFLLRERRLHQLVHNVTGSWQENTRSAISGRKLGYRYEKQQQTIPGSSVYNIIPAPIVNKNSSWQNIFTQWGAALGSERTLGWKISEEENLLCLDSIAVEQSVYFLASFLPGKTT